MAYAPVPHIEANFEPVGTGTPYKVDWVNNVAGVMVAAGWEAQVLATSGPQGQYNRTVAPVVLRIRQNGEFDSFGLFASPPGDSCDGLAVWSVNRVGEQLNVGWDTEPDEFTEVRNCCVCNGDCSSGSKWGPDTGGGPCLLDCVDGGAGLCVTASTWLWSSGDMPGQHAALIQKIVENVGGCTQDVKSEIISASTTGTFIESYVAIWCEGGTTNPLVGPIDFNIPNVGAAFNSEVIQMHGGWVLQNQPSNTDENFITVYIAVEDSADTHPQLYSFSTYTASTHPILYIELSSPLSGLAHQTNLDNETNDMRMIANPYHAHMYSHLNGTAAGTGSNNYFDIGALRTIPLNGEDPTDPSSWDFKRAVFHIGEVGAGLGKGLNGQNWINPDTNQWYLIEDDVAGVSTAVTGVDGHQLSVTGFVWTLNNEVTPIEWISGEAFYSEPWAGYNAFAGTTMSPILGQLWDCIVPSKVGGSGYFFWDGEWWTHWQTLRTETASGGGPVANISWRVGFQTLEGAEPVNGTWAGLPDPHDVFLYTLQQNGVLDPFPWGNVTALSISNSTFDGGTTTRTLTATCTQHPDAPDDGDKLVAIHSNRNYFTFTPEIITIGDGDTTGTSIVTAVAPGLGGTTAMIFADSITQASVSVTVND